MSRCGIDWPKGLDNFTDEDYDKIMAETTKIIETGEPVELLPGACYDRAIIYKTRCGYEKSISDNTSAIQLNCRHIGAAYHNRGWVYYAMDQYDAALADFNACFRYRPDGSNDETFKNAIAWMLEHKWHATVFFCFSISSFDICSNVFPLRSGGFCFGLPF